MLLLLPSRLAPGVYLRDGGEGGRHGGGELLGVVPPGVRAHGQDERRELRPPAGGRAELGLVLLDLVAGHEGCVGARARARPGAGARAVGRLRLLRLATERGAAEGGAQRLAAERGLKGGGGAERGLQRGVAERRVQGGGAQGVGEGVAAERRLDVGVAKRRLEGGIA